MVWECLELLVLIQRKRQKKNEEMKREAELRKKYEENLDKPITITQRQLMEAQAHVMANGKFMRIAKERDPQMGAMLVLTVAPIMADLVSELFKDSLSDIVKEEEKIIMAENNNKPQVRVASIEVELGMSVQNKAGIWCKPTARMVLTVDGGTSPAQRAAIIKQGFDEVCDNIEKLLEEM